MLKYLGIIMVSFAVWLLGGSVSSSIKRKTELEDGLLMLLSHMKIMISTGAMPLGEIYASFSDDALERSGFLAALRGGGCNALYDVVTEKGEYIFPDAGIREYAGGFAAAIGKCRSPSDGAELCAKYTALIQGRIDQIRQKDKTRAELAGKLGIIAAAFTALMFI